jgi:outer membrane protein assembly factor BamA
VKNTVKVEGVKRGSQFDNLIDLVRPIPNKKFMDIFPMKVSLWANHQPKFDSITGKTKDSKFKKWCRKIGEPPVLLDTTDIQRSIAQINLAMFQRGYFDAETQVDIQYFKKQKARVNYFVTPNSPYYIRNIDYLIDIPEYKRIVITDTENSLLKKGMIYNEDDLVAERNRIVSKIKDQGFFYTTSHVVTFLVDTNKAFKYMTASRQPTIALTIKISFDDVNDEQIISKSRNRYKFNNVLIYTNYDLNFEKNLHLDTVAYFDYRNKSDSTLYEFVTVKKLIRRTNKLKLVKDFKSRTIAGAVWMKRGDMFSQTAYERTYKKLRDLRNFSMIHIIYNEDETIWDSINKIGALNTTLRLTRAKQHSINSDFDLRTDRTSLALSYTNKNIFRRAEYLNISAFGSVYYYRWFNSVIKKEKSDNSFLVYGEVGGVASLEFPRLLMLPRYQNINFWGYSTEIKFSCNYIQLFSRLNLQASYTYKWAPTRHLMHSVSPVDLATLDSRSNRHAASFEDYPESYLRKFDKFFLPSAKYSLSYTMPNKRGRNILRLNFSFETAGLLLYSINAAVNKNEMWTVMNRFTYGTYEKFDFNLTYTRVIDKKNAFAMRFIFGMAIPYAKDAVVPFERSFFVGGANSMRGWVFRQLGPGGYNAEGKTMERVGDMKLELNLEYRGPIYRAFKFAVFSDIGNVWLLSKYDEMPNAEFNFNTFYKQIAVCVGLGLRLDFNFFLIRLDYGLPIYDPSKPIGNYWINKNWFTNDWWVGTQGIQLGINYAF